MSNRKSYIYGNLISLLYDFQVYLSQSAKKNRRRTLKLAILLDREYYFLECTVFKKKSNKYRMRVIFSSKTFPTYCLDRTDSFHNILQVCFRNVVSNPVYPSFLSIVQEILQIFVAISLTAAGPKQHHLFVLRNYKCQRIRYKLTSSQKL